MESNKKNKEILTFNSTWDEYKIDEKIIFNTKIIRYAVGIYTIQMNIDEFSKKINEYIKESPFNKNIVNIEDFSGHIGVEAQSLNTCDLGCCSESIFYQ